MFHRYSDGSTSEEYSRHDKVTARMAHLCPARRFAFASAYAAAPITHFISFLK
jgi:hypothetical protein